MPMKLYVGDIVELKKSHPCGGTSFEIMRCGMDFRIKCLTCNKQMWIERQNLEKRVKNVKSLSEN